MIGPTTGRGGSAIDVLRKGAEVLDRKYDEGEVENMASYLVDNFGPFVDRIKSLADNNGLIHTTAREWLQADADWGNLSEEHIREAAAEMASIIRSNLADMRKEVRKIFGSDAVETFERRIRKGSS
jgi:hypothetical protein